MFKRQNVKNKKLNKMVEKQKLKKHRKQKKRKISLKNRK